MSKLCKIILTIGIAVTVLFSAMSAYSQGKRNLLAPEAAAPAPRPSGGGGGGGVRTKYVSTTITKTVKITSYTVVSEPGAKIVIEQTGNVAKPYRKVINTGTDGTALFEGLPGGTYKLEASKEGFATERADKITIVPQKAQATSLYPQEITYSVKIATNIKNGGDVRFAPAVYKGKDAEGNILSDQLGPYCVAPIKPNGEAEISGLKKKYYDIDIRPDSLEFAKTFRGIDLTTIVDDANADSTAFRTYPLEIEKNQSTETFSTAWIASDWEMPTAWRLEDRRMKVKNVSGIAIPANPRYKNYVNFEMKADVRLRENGTVGFVFREEDPQNYYLFQISGERGESPNNAQLFVVENGRAQQVNSAPASGFAKTLASDDGFEISIVGDNTAFTVWITDANTGKQSTLARFPDTFKTFQKGAVGIAGSPKSNFEVKTFQVCTPTCPK